MNALEAYCSFGTVVCTNFPIGYSFGIDCMIWTTDKLFKGIKMIPDGIHYFHYTKFDNEPRLGTFIEIIRGQIIVLTFNDGNLFLMDDKDDINIIVKAVNSLELDRFLAPYPSEINKSWKILSSYISIDITKKLHLNIIQQSLAKEVKNSEKKSNSLESLKESKESNSDSNQDIEYHTPDSEKKSNSNQDIEYYTPDFTLISPLAESLINENGETRTNIALDRTSLLIKYLSRHYNFDAFLGEIQVAFVLFLVSQQELSFEHWKAIIILFCHSESYFGQHSIQTEKFIDLLIIHLKEFPDDFCSIFQQNFMVDSLRYMTSAFHNIGKKKLQKKLVKFAHEYFHIELLLEEEDDVPIIVADDYLINEYNKQEERNKVEKDLMELEITSDSSEDEPVY